MRTQYTGKKYTVSNHSESFQAMRRIMAQTAAKQEGFTPASQQHYPLDPLSGARADVNSAADYKSAKDPDTQNHSGHFYCKNSTSLEGEIQEWREQQRRKSDWSHACVNALGDRE